MPAIIIVSSEFPPGPGGIGNHAFHLASQLHMNGWEVRVISPQDYASNEEIERFNQSRPFRITKLASGRGRLREVVSRFRILSREIQGGRVDILLASGMSAVLLASLAARIFGLRLVVIGHGKEFGMQGLIQRTMLRWAYRRAEAIICVSYFTQALMQKMGLKPGISKVIQNGADHERFQVLSEELKRTYVQKFRLGYQPVLLTVGSVTDRKGQEIVIRALPEILKEFPDTHYLMAGLPFEKQKLEALSRELGVVDHVCFLGSVGNEDLVGYLNCCDLFVVTSRSTEDGDCEGFGIAVVEAALCGKPAVVSANSGLIEAIVPGKTGIAVPEGDADATAQAILSLLRDPGLRRAMGETAQTYSREQQTWQTKGLEYDRFLRDHFTVTSPETS